MSQLPKELLAAIASGMKPTGMDRAISSLFPGWGMRRMQARAALALGGTAWVGARRDLPELRGFLPTVQSPDDEQRWDREFLLARTTELERNDALAGGAIVEQVLSVVGTGLSLQPEPARALLGWSLDQAADWAEQVKQRFQLWAQDARECDIARKRNFYQAQSIVYRTVASRGDAFVLLPRRRQPGGIWNLKLQLLEGDRCCQPRGKVESENFSQGVEIDPTTGEHRRYWFCRKHPTAMSLTESDWKPYEVWGKDGMRQVIHLMHEHRLDLRRGYPLLAPIILPLKQLSRLSESELAASVVTSFFAVMIEKGGTGPGPFGNAQVEDGGGVVQLGPAMVGELNPGEKLVTVAPSRPNAAFDPFWNSLVGQIAMRLQIPPEVLLKKFTSSYTAARAALLQYWKYVTVERENFLAPDFCQPIYEAWLVEDVAAGRTIAPGFFKDPFLRAAFSSARWIGDNPPILDPLKEVNAAVELVNWGFSTYAEQTSRLTSGDFEANLERLKRELLKRKEAGLVPDPTPPARTWAPEPPQQGA